MLHYSSRNNISTDEERINQQNAQINF